MEDVARWVWCGITAVMAVLGLFVAADATNPVAYWGGLGFFVVAVLFIMLQIKQAFDHGEAQAHSRH
jgi:hypothetical protein